MSEKIDKFVGDMRKMLEFEKSYGKMQYTQQMSTTKLIVHAFEDDLIKSSLDLVYICNELPEVSYDLCRYFDTYVLAKGLGSPRGLRRLKALMRREERARDRDIEIVHI